MSDTSFPAPERRRRTARLAALDEVADAGIRHERRQAVRALLRRPLLLATDLGGDFARVRKHRDWLRLWFAQHPDWQLVTDGDAARLVKCPAHPGDATRPCRDVKTGQPLRRRSYVMLCLALAHLSRADRQETLGQTLQAMLGMAAAEPRLAAAGIRLDPDNQDARRDLVQALRLLVGWGVLTRVQGEEDRYVTDAAHDVLYNVNRPVLARLLAAARPPSLISETDFPARLTALVEGGLPVAADSDARHKRLRVRIFRQLLDDPLLSYDELDDDGKTYLDRQRGSILPEIENATGLIREIRAEGIAMTDLTGELTDYGLPEEGTEGHLTLLIATWLADLLREMPGTSVTFETVVARTASLIAEHHRRWRKNVREAGQDRALAALVIERLEGLALLRREEDGLIRPLPVIGRYGLREEVEQAGAGLLP